MGVSMDSLSGMRGKVAPACIVVSKSKENNSISSLPTAIDGRDADIVWARKPAPKSTRPSRRKPESVMHDTKVPSAGVRTTRKNDLLCFLVKVLGWLLFSALNIASRLLDHLITKFPICVSIATVPARIVVAAFSSQPPWCTSPPVSATDRDYQRHLLQTMSYQRRPSMESMWALDALSLDFSV